ncbi:MAG: AAA family ATPase [Clostridiales bacterium]|nr:AAA family ATPase [Clostridiales bacterium]
MTSSTYITNPAIGREMELQDLELILISPKKSPILLGEAGVGKTSIVEGLSWLIQRGEVPKLLENRQIYKLTTTSILSGTKYVGEMEERVRQLMDELSHHPEIILFIDEIHTIVGAGSTESSNNDISNMLKPYIDRGDIKIIGSTTTEEYHQYVMTDKALVHRFYPIAVDEPDEETTLAILSGTIPSIEYATKVTNHYSTEKTTEILKTLIQLSHKDNQPENQRTRRPELPLTLLEMAFSYAALHERNAVSIEDFISAVRHTNLLTKKIKETADQYFSII